MRSVQSPIGHCVSRVAPLLRYSESERALGERRHKRWLDGQRFDHPAQRLALQEMLNAVQATVERVDPDHFRCVIHLHATVQQHELEIAVTDGISRSRTTTSIKAACCSAVFTGTKRIVGRLIASHSASASAASFLPRLTYGLTSCGAISFTVCPNDCSSRASTYPSRCGQSVPRTVSFD
jgi:hypothetical protein